MIFPYGKFSHPRFGDLDFREPFFAEVKRNFDQKVRRIDPFIDLEHKNGEAAGWIRELDVRAGQGLFALIEWTSLGVDKVRNKIYRYFSPEYGSYLDASSGKTYANTLTAVALTNVPFLKTLPDVKLAFSDMTVDDCADDVCDTCKLPCDECECEKLAEERKPPPSPKGRKPTDDEKAGDAKAKAENDNADASGGPRTEPAPTAAEAAQEDEEDENDTTKKKGGNRKINKPAGNQGAPQPGQMRGPKPSITRSRTPDPGSQSNSMSDQNSGTEEIVTLAEMKEVTERLSSELTAERERATALAERVKLAEQREVQRDVDDEVKRLSEAFVPKAGSTVKYGIPTVVTEMYAQIALSEPSARKGIFEMLTKLQEVGVVALTERGSGHSGVENDPGSEATTVPVNQRIYNRAVKLAEEAGKDFVTLDYDERTLYSLRAEREIRA